MNCYRRLPKPKSSYGMKGYLLDVSCAPVHWIIGENRMKKLAIISIILLFAGIGSALGETGHCGCSGSATCPQATCGSNCGGSCVQNANIGSPCGDNCPSNGCGTSGGCQACCGTNCAACCGNSAAKDVSTSSPCGAKCPVAGCGSAGDCQACCGTNCAACCGVANS